MTGTEGPSSEGLALQNRVEGTESLFVGFVGYWSRLFISRPVGNSARCSTCQRAYRKLRSRSDFVRRHCMKISQGNGKEIKNEREGWKKGCQRVSVTMHKNGVFDIVLQICTVSMKTWIFRQAILDVQSSIVIHAAVKHFYLCDICGFESCHQGAVSSTGHYWRQIA